MGSENNIPSVQLRWLPATRVIGVKYLLLHRMSRDVPAGAIDSWLYVAED